MGKSFRELTKEKIAPKKKVITKEEHVANEKATTKDVHITEHTHILGENCLHLDFSMFEELTSDIYVEETVRANNEPTDELFENILKPSPTEFAEEFSEEWFFVIKTVGTSSFVKAEKFGLQDQNIIKYSTSDRKVKIMMELCMTYIHPNFVFTKQSQVENGMKFCLFIYETFGVTPAFFNKFKELRLAFYKNHMCIFNESEELKKDKTLAPLLAFKIEKPAVESVVPRGEPMKLYCKECESICKRQNLKSIGNRGGKMVEKSEFCSEHTEKINFRCRLVASLIFNATESTEVEEYIKECMQESEDSRKEIQAYRNFKTIWTSNSQPADLEQITAAQRSDYLFCSALKNILFADPSVLNTPVSIFYQANENYQITRLRLEALLTRYTVFDSPIVLRESFYFEKSSGNWSNAPRVLSHKAAEDEKVSPFYGGVVAKEFVAYLMTGIVLFGMELAENKSTALLTKLNPFSLFQLKK